GSGARRGRDSLFGRHAIPPPAWRASAISWPFMGAAFLFSKSSLVGEVVRRVALVEAVEAAVHGLADCLGQPDALVGRHLQGHLVEEVTQIDLLEQAIRFRRADDLLEEGKDQGRSG